jgi:hypothetical protein
MSEGEWKDDADWQDDGLGDDGWDDDNPNQWVDSPVSPSRLAASSKPIPSKFFISCEISCLKFHDSVWCEK